MIEGPQGCSWGAVVVKSSKDKLEVRLESLHGTCMYEPEPCGASGDVITVALSEKSTQLKKDDKLRVWVDRAASGLLQATLSHPECTRSTPTP